METYLCLKIDHRKPVKDLAEMAAQRVYNLDGVDNVEVCTDFPALPAPEVELTNGHAQ